MSGRRIVIALVGGTLVALGTLLLFLPGPGVLLLALGILVLAMEFEWARTALGRFRAWLRRPRKEGTPS